jgi:acetoacetate decarboxylase
MNIDQIKQQAFSMPFTSPIYPKSKFKFVNREFLVIAYETDLDALRQIVPEPLQLTDPIIKFEFIRMPDSSGFGDYTESGQTIPVTFNGENGSYVHSMFLDDAAAITAGREIWGFPKKYAKPTLVTDEDTVLGRLSYNSVEIAIGTMGYKHHEYDCAKLKQSLETDPNYLLKIIPHCNGQDVEICQLVKYYLEDVTVKGAWIGPTALQLFEHALAPVAELPVKRVVSGLHFVSDLTLGFGEVIHDYLK